LSFELSFEDLYSSTTKDAKNTKKLTVFLIFDITKNHVVTT